MSRHLTLSLLRDKMNGYWGERLLGQFDYLEEYIRCYKRDDFAALLDQAVAKAQETFDREGAFAKESALAIEAILAPVSAALKATTVSCIGHAHIDMNWMWRFDETVSITVETARTMLMLMREYPTFTFGQSQASVYRILEEYAPELLPEIRERVREGRWEVTASTWVEADKNMINGESLTRHLLYTKRYLKNLLGLSDNDFELDFEPDTFGHSVNVPEVLANAGVKYYYHCRGYEGEILYRWKAPSGAMLTMFREPTWYNETITANSFAHVPDFCSRYGMDRIIHVFGVGDHGGGATRRDIERILDMNTWPCFPTIGFGRYSDFYHATDSLDLKVVTGELNMVFTGCYTTQTRVKRANRIAEAALFESETMSAAAALMGKAPYDTKAYMEAWENVLFNHFHDILPGSGVTDTREYALGQFQKTIASASQNKVRAARAIASMLDTAKLLPAEDDRLSTSEGAGVGFGVEGFNVTQAGSTRGMHRLYTIFNPTQYDRSDLAELTVWDWPGKLDHVCVTDEHGNEVPFQLLDAPKQGYWGHEYFRLLVDASVKGFGCRTLVVGPRDSYTGFFKSMDPRLDHIPDYTLENEFVRARFSPDDLRMTSLLDKQTGAELLAAPAGFRYIEEEVSKGMTAWRVGRYAKIQPVVTGVTVRGTINGPLMKGFTFDVEVEHSKLTVTVTLGKHDRLVHFDMKCAWREFGTESTGVPQLQYQIPVLHSSGKTVYSVMNGQLERADYDDDVPALRYGVTKTAQGGVMLASDSKYGFRSFDGSLSLTLIRSSYDPDTTPEAYDHRVLFGVGAANGCYEAEADGICHPLTTITVAPAHGTIAPDAQFLAVEGLTLTGLKLAEDGSGDLIVHGWALADAKASLRFAAAVKSAAFCDIHEHAAAAAALNGFEVKAGKTYQLRITF